MVTKHIKNIFSNKELSEKVVSAKFAHTTSHGALKGKTQTKTTWSGWFYNYWKGNCGISIVVICGLPKAETRVRFSHPAQSKGFQQQLVRRRGGRPACRQAGSRFSLQRKALWAGKTEEFYIPFRVNLFVSFSLTGNLIFLFAWQRSLNRIYFETIMKLFSL